MKLLFAMVTAWAVALVGCTTMTHTHEITITLEPSVTYQTVRHFGASAAWWAQAVGAWDETTVSEILDLLFDNERGIGLDIIRYNLGGGKERAIVQDPLRRAASIEAEPGVFDRQRDAEAITIINGTVERGASVIVFSNSPPERLTITGATTGNGRRSNLRPGAEPEFARFLVGATEYLARELNWPIVAISPINEPQVAWQPSKGQEGSYWSADEAVRVVRAVHDELRHRDLDYTISAVESGEMKLTSNHQYVQDVFGDPELSKALGHYSVHSYWSSPDDRQRLGDYMSRTQPDVELWMTEWTEMRSGRDTGMDAALILAITVHQDMVLANVSSWQYWIALSPYDYRDGLIYIDPSSQTYEVAKKLWALGNWSRFIDPGAVRIEIHAPQVRGLNLSAYMNPSGEIVVVAVNADSSRSHRLNLAPAFSGARCEVFETSATRNLTRVHDGPGSGIEIGPRSIQTIVINHSGT